MPKVAITTVATVSSIALLVAARIIHNKTHAAWRKGSNPWMFGSEKEADQYASYFRTVPNTPAKLPTFAAAVAIISTAIGLLALQRK